MWSPPVNQLPMGETRAATTARSNSYQARDVGESGFPCLVKLYAGTCVSTVGRAGVFCRSWSCAPSNSVSSPASLSPSESECDSYDDGDVSSCIEWSSCRWLLCDISGKMPPSAALSVLLDARSRMCILLLKGLDSDMTVVVFEADTIEKIDKYHEPCKARSRSGARLKERASPITVHA